MAERQGLTDDAAFREVFCAEMEEWVAPRRAAEGSPIAADRFSPRVDNRLVGLALSGGGVRASTYSLGALQRLARLGMLRFVDYLSTASGGGYVGASWSSLSASSEEYGSRPESFPFKFIDNAAEPDRQIFDRESPAVRHIRAHGNWLAPGLGLFDPWTWIAATRYLVSTAINLLLVPAPWVMALIGLAMLVPVTWWDREYPMSSSLSPLMALGPALLLLFVATTFVATWWRPPDDGTPGAEFKSSRYPWLKKLLIAGVLLTVADLFILGVAAIYQNDQEVGRVWKWAWGLVTPAVLAGAAGVAYRFFTAAPSGEAPSASGGKKLAGLMVGIVSYVALASLLLFLFWAMDCRAYKTGCPSGAVANTRAVLAMTGFWIAVAVAMLAVSPRWFLNRFSLNVVYRRALGKAFILRAKGSSAGSGAGTGVIPRGADSFLVADLKQTPPPDMPYHLIVTSLNTSGDSQLERLGRKSDGMTLAPIYSGSRISGYGKTDESKAFEDLTLVDAMVTSGAAFSPNMGRATSTSLAILLTLFNARVGRWIPNPNDDRRRPWVSWRPVVWYWLKELFGMASAEDRYVYLTDGGHFDNSAVYELLKRRCKYIIAVDASSDIGNLATVARLARIDLGVQMDVDLSAIMPDAGGVSERPFVVAKLKYPEVEGDSEQEGVLVFVTTSLTGGERPDLARYAELNRNFPRHSTADQLFDQAQFESYRELGHAATGMAFPTASPFGDPTLTRESLGRAFDGML